MIDFKNLRICTINVRSIAEYRTRQQFFRWLRLRQEFDIIALQEIGASRAPMTDAVKKQWTREWKGSCCFSHHCAILSNNPRLKLHNTNDALDGRVLWTDLICDGNMDDALTIIN